MQNLHNFFLKKIPPITNLFFISELILLCKRLTVFCLSSTTCGVGSEAGKQNTSEGTTKRQFCLLFFFCYIFFMCYLYFFDVSVFCNCWARKIKAIISLLKIQCSLPLLSCFWLKSQPKLRYYLCVGNIRTKNAVVSNGYKENQIFWYTRSLIVSSFKDSKYSLAVEDPS